MHRLVLSSALISACSLFGCGLIDSNITEFNLSLPDQEFTIDTSQWNLMGDATFPGIPCQTTNDACPDLTAAVCDGPECTGICDGATNTCKVMVQVGLSQTINLVEEKPELQTIENQPFLNVTIDAVEYQIVENTLNFDSPGISLYVAPQNVMTPESNDARLVGTIEPIPAMRQLDWTPMNMNNAGENNLRDMMGDYRSIFNVIVGATVEITEGTPLPSGRAVARVGVDAHAGL